MVYEQKSKKNGKTYFLHQKGHLFFFSGKKGAGAIDLPTGYTVVESEKTGLPLIKKK